jgi:hypothetical protein
MPPDWLSVVAWIYLCVCFACAGVIGYDIVFGRRRQPMGVMNFVFPITALYFGPAALALYWRWGRVGAPPARAPRPMTGAKMPHMAAAAAGPGMHECPGQGIGPTGDARSADPVMPARPRWATMAIEVSHCGSGCTLGDLISEWVIYAFAVTVAGRVLFAEYIGDYVLAVALGIVFQYFAIAPMRGLGVRKGLKAAAKADFISLTFFEVGLFEWMALMAFVFFPAPHHLMANSAAYWFLMQVGMMIGFFTSWPANVWLVNRGIKVPM